MATGVAAIADGAVRMGAAVADFSSDEGNALAETEHYLVWETRDPDGEAIFHLELGSATLHFFREEWDEFVQLMKVAASNSR